MSEFKFPTENVKLPSQGHFYSEEHPLSKGEVEMKYMTAKEEDILTNSNYIQKGVVLDKLLESLIISPTFDLDDMLLGDKNSLLVASRILGYGKDYKFKLAGVEETVDLTTLKNTEIDLSLTPKGTNEFDYTLPNSGTKITYKILTGKDEKTIQEELEGYKKINKDASPEISTRLRTMIISVEGDKTPQTINDFVSNYLLAMDSREFRKHYQSRIPDVDLSFRSQDGEQRNIPINLSFFWPDSTI
jgi:hypothetical protein|tara:strand:+ start:45 stop:779 length:735 start_codon:yes stop_codon:yes gene_type:complete